MNCKPPCMAIITRSDFREHIGLPVEVFAESIRGSNGAFYWRVRASKPMPAWRNRDCTSVGMSADFWHLDHCLRPITGLPITDDVTDDEKVST